MADSSASDDSKNVIMTSDESDIIREDNKVNNTNGKNEKTQPEAEPSASPVTAAPPLVLPIPSVSSHESAASSAEDSSKPNNNNNGNLNFNINNGKNDINGGKNGNNVNNSSRRAERERSRVRGGGDKDNKDNGGGKSTKSGKSGKSDGGKSDYEKGGGWNTSKSSQKGKGKNDKGSKSDGSKGKGDNPYNAFSASGPPGSNTPGSKGSSKGGSFTPKSPGPIPPGAPFGYINTRVPKVKIYDYNRLNKPVNQHRICILVRGLPGSGKSTLITLLGRLLGGNSGSILGQNIVDYDLCTKDGQMAIDEKIFTAQELFEKGCRRAFVNNEEKRFVYLDSRFKTKEERDSVEELVENHFMFRESDMEKMRAQKEEEEKDGEDGKDKDSDDKDKDKDSPSSSPKKKKQKLDPKATSKTSSSTANLNKTLFIDLVHDSDSKRTNSNTGEVSYMGPYSNDHKEVCIQRLKNRGNLHYQFKPYPEDIVRSKDYTEIIKDTELMTSVVQKCKEHVESYAHESDFLTPNEKTRSWSKYLAVNIVKSPVENAMEVINVLRSMTGEKRLGNGEPGRRRRGGNEKKEDKKEGEEGDKKESKDTKDNNAKSDSENNDNDDVDPDADLDLNHDADQLKRRFNNYWDDHQTNERQKRGISDSQICNTCKIDESELPPNEKLVNVTSVLQKDEDDRCRELNRRSGMKRGQEIIPRKVKETKFCNECWYYWNVERKNKLKKAEEDGKNARRESMESKRLFWELLIEDDIKKTVAKKLPEWINLVQKPHITLVYFGGSGNQEEEKTKAGLDDVETLEGLHESLQAMDNTEHKIQVDKIVVASNLVCALVSFVDFPVPSTTQNQTVESSDGSKELEMPFHVTLGVKEGTSPAEANEVVKKVISLSEEDLAKEDIACVALKKIKQYNGTINLRMTDDDED